MQIRAKLLRIVLILLATMPLQSTAHAQTYPAKGVRIIVPFPPGAGGDFVTRLFAAKLSETFGQQFIVDNRGGVSGNMGAEIAARAVADGYTLLTISITLAVAQSLYSKLNYDLTRDFTPVALFATTPYVLAVNPSIPATNVKQLLALAKARPDQIMFGSAGDGSGSHLAGVRFQLQGGVNLLHVPYKGTAPAIAGLIGGEISIMFATQMLPQVKAGRLRALAITSAQRSVVAPDLPTVAESGLPEYEAGIWFGLAAPTGTSREIIRRLNAEITRVAQMQEVRNQILTQTSGEPMSGTPEQAGAYIKNEILQGKKVIAASRLKIE